MYSYHLSDFGDDVLATIEERYPELLKSDPVIAVAVAQIKIAQLAIEGRMSEISNGEPDEE